MAKARTELDLGEILENLRELSSREDALKLEFRKLSEERREVAAKLARAEEAVKASTLGGLREPPEELRSKPLSWKGNCTSSAINWQRLRKNLRKSATRGFGFSGSPYPWRGNGPKRLAKKLTISGSGIVPLRGSRQL